MNSSAQKLPELDPAEELGVYITVYSIKHDCHLAHLLSPVEIQNGETDSVIQFLIDRLKENIQEKLNAIS